MIGFKQTAYSVREDAGSVTVSVSVMSGAPVGDVVVTLTSTVAGDTATGWAVSFTYAYYIYPPVLNLIFFMVLELYARMVGVFIEDL